MLAVERKVSSFLSFSFSSFLFFFTSLPPLSPPNQERKTVRVPYLMLRSRTRPEDCAKDRREPVWEPT